MLDRHRAAGLDPAGGPVNPHDFHDHRCRWAIEYVDEGVGMTMRRHIAWVALGGLLWTAGPGSVRAAEVVTFVGERTQRPVDEAFGPAKAELVALAQPILMGSPNGQRLHGYLMALAHPRTRVFWWTYQSVEGSVAPAGGWLSWWLHAGAIYADDNRIARFSSVNRRGLWLRESTEVADSLDEGLARAKEAIQWVAPEFFGAGGWYLLNQKVALAPVLRWADHAFFLLPLHAEGLLDASIVHIERSPREWRFVLHGGNPAHPSARLVLGNDGSAISFAVDRALSEHE